MSIQLRSNFRGKLLSCAGALAMVGAAFSAHASEAPGASQQASEQRIEFDLPAQRLSRSLENFGAVANRQVMFDAAVVRGKVAQRVVGEMTPNEALSRLLQGTGLVYEITNANVILVRAEERHVGAGRTQSAQAPVDEPQLVTRASADATDEPVASQVEDEITVIGSNIRGGRDPVDVVTTIDIQNPLIIGVVDIADLVTGSPVTAGLGGDGTVSAQIGTGADVSKVANLRGLGANRTLNLINGRSVPPAGSGIGAITSPLTAVPAVIADRVDVLKQGASSVYGSEAIAGAIDTRTLRGLDGFRFDGAASMPVDPGGEQYRVGAAWGRAFDRGGITMAAEYLQSQELSWRDREFSQCEVNPRLDPNTGARTDIDPATGAPTCTGTPFGYLLATQIPNPATTIIPGSGSFRGVPGYRQAITNVDRLNIDDVEGLPEGDLFPSSGRFSLWADGEFDVDILGGVTLGFEAAYSQTRQEVDAFPAAFQITSPTGSAANPFPSLTPPPPSPPPPGLPPLPPIFSLPETFTATLYNNFYEPVGESQLDVGRLLLKSEGALPIGNWRWRADYQYGQSRAEDTTNYLSASRLAQAIDLVSTPSGLACRDPSNGCVPLNIFAPDLLTLTTAPTQAQRDFLTGRDTNVTENSRHEVTILFDGDLFEMPTSGGAAAAAFGVNFRRDEITVTPSQSHLRRDRYQFLTPSVAVDGSQEVLGIFAEFEAPLLRGRSFADDVVLNLSGRYTDYGNFDKFTYKSSLRWDLTPDWSLRASYATSFRAPDIFEGTGNSTGLVGANTVSGFVDPCNSYGSIIGIDPVVQANCAAVGLSPTFLANNIPVRTGPNPELQAESGRSYTFGVSASPSFLNGANITIDYFNIEVTDGISQFSFTQALSNCYASVNFQSPYCDPSVVGARDATGNLTFLEGRFINAGVETASGIDIEASYELNFSNFDVTLRTLASHLMERSQRPIKGADAINLEGSIGYPEWALNGTAALTYRDWTATYGMRYISSVGQAAIDPDYYNNTPEGRALISSVDAYVYHSFALRRNFENSSVTLSVDNILDEMPTIVSSGGAGTAGIGIPRNGNVANGYDLLGRRLAISFSARY